MATAQGSVPNSMGAVQNYCGIVTQGQHGDNYVLGNCYVIIGGVLQRKLTEDDKAHLKTIPKNYPVRVAIRNEAVESWRLGEEILHFLQDSGYAATIGPNYVFGGGPPFVGVDLTLTQEPHGNWKAGEAVTLTPLAVITVGLAPSP